MKNKRTNIHFDYGGSYSEDHEWISGKSVYAISLMTLSLEDITYSVLEKRIQKKIMIDQSKGKLRLSYTLSKARRESYIVDNEDVYVYLTSVDTEGLKPVLHVDLISSLDINQNVEQLSRVEERSSFGLNYGEIVPHNRVDEVGNGDSMVIVFEARNEVAVFEEVFEDTENGNGCNEECPNERHNESETVDSPIDVHGGHEDFDGRHEYVNNAAPVSQIDCVVEWEDGVDIEINQEFSSREAVQDLVSRAANQNCFRVETYKSDSKRLMLRCRQAKSAGCNWYLRAAKTKSSSFWTIRKYNKIHTCSRLVTTTSSSTCLKGTKRLVASMLHQYYPGIYDTPAPKIIMSVAQTRLGVTLSYSTALRGKKQQVTDVRGSPEKGYENLFSYLYMLERVNPGTKTYVELAEGKRFKYFFIALGASIEGFASMRKVIVVDATFLKTIYGGMLVFATTQDPNHHHYPLAFSVIDRVKDDSWRWFLEKLKTIIPDDAGLVFISDRNSSIIKTVMEVYPKAKHAHCIWHLCQNVRGHVKKDKDDLAQKFRDCAHAYTKTGFDKQYVEFKRMFPKGGDYLDNSIKLERWTRAYFEGDKYNIDTSNAAESMNNVFKKARRYHLITMIDAIVEKFSEWFNTQRQASCCLTNKKLVPFVENVLHERCAVATNLLVTELNSYFLEYNAKGLSGKTYVVDLKMKTCSCRCFDIDKYPCVHAIAAVMAYMRKEGRKTNIHIHDLCSTYYLISTWILAYCRTIYLVPHEDHWRIPSDIKEMYALPPDYTPKQGRTRETRFPSTGERRKKQRSNTPVSGINLERWLQPEEDQEDDDNDAEEETATT